jgi:hypothetical protein
MLVLVATLLLFLLWWSRREGFSIQVKADGGMLKALHKGTNALVRDASAKAAALPGAALSMMPFKHTFRQWHRSLFKKNIGLVYA